MHEHAAHGDAVEDSVSAPFLAKLGFACGIIAALFEATIKLAPAAYVIGLVGLVACGIGFVQGAIQARPLKGAVAGAFCCGFAVLFWLLARDDINSVVGGRDAWPSWLF